MVNFFIQLGHFFKKEDHLKFFLFFLGMLLNSFLEIIGIGLLMPFIMLLGKPDSLGTNPWVGRIYHFFNFHDYRQFIIILAAAVIVIYIVKNILLFFISFWQTKFIFEKQASVMSRLFSAYLLSPYSYHLRISLAKLQRNLAAVNNIMQGIVLQLFYALTEGVVVVSLFVVLIFMQPLFTVVIFLVLGAGLFIYFHCTKEKLHEWSDIYHYLTMMMLQRMNQGLGSIKEAKLFGKEHFLVDRYHYHCHQCAVESTKMEVVSRNPRSFIEMLVVSLVMLAVIFYLLLGKTTEQIFAVISLFAVASIRLMPSLSRISSALSTIKSNVRIFDEVHHDLINCERSEPSLSYQSSNSEKIDFQKCIEIKDLAFSYENASSKALDHVSFVIPKNTTVGFVGPSGAGKTTVVDIILGLLNPTSGEVAVDGRNIQENTRSWQDKIGYIPQAIYLCDDTIKNNIAFGFETSDIVEEQVWQALRLAQLEEFIRSLPQGIETTVGERGIRLSGGQRQRISIARALYNDPEILVMDEATAALDNETERVFMESLVGLSGAKTILIIAHRLTTVRKCDVIFFLKNGRILDAGTYDQLLARCPDFRQMAGGESF